MRMIVQFGKSERLRHIGHLDLQRAMQRILRRSGLPIAYSNGFNPHMLLSFASPLPVGVAGDEELFEVTLASPVTEEVFAAALAKAMPPDFPLGRVRLVDPHHPKLMASLRTAAYHIQLQPGAEAQAMEIALESFLARTEIAAIRKSKRGETPCDIRPMIHALRQEPEGLYAQVSFTEKETLKPDLLLQALAEHAGVALPPFFMKRLRLFAEGNVPLMDCQGW